MPFDENLAGRIRVLTEGEAAIAERRMFGGLAFLLNGNMAVAASGEGGLLVRVDPRSERKEAAGVAPMVMRGRELDGWLRVSATVVQDDDALARWVRVGIEFARTLPPKQ